MELFPQSWKSLWKEWELRGMILLSLTAQIVLISLGKRRKYIARIWIRVTVWSAYLLADSIATMAAGILSNDLGEVKKDGTHVDAKHEFTAIWAPLMLLHLGGADTITAFSLEDNELWKRHLFGVVTQSMATFYILLMAWTGSSLSLLFIVMFCVGLVKYSERVWVLYSASDNQFRDSIPDIPSNDSKIMEECKLKQMEGYYLTTHQLLEIEVTDHSANPSTDQSVSHRNELLTAYSLLEMVKRLFANLILGFQDRDASRAIFERTNMSYDKAFKVIEIELSLIYDLLYTKAKAVYTYWGIARRIIGIFLILIVLVVVSLDEILFVKKKHHHSKIDFTLTLVLLAFALLLELCSFVELLLSDQTAHWLIKHKKTTILQTINRTLRTCWFPQHNWSNSVGQFSLLSFSLREKPLRYDHALKMLGINEMIEIYQYDTPVALSEDMKYIIFNEIKKIRPWAEMHSYDTDLKSLYGRRGGRTLQTYNRVDLDWSVKLEFDQSILIWHLATEILYFHDYIPPEVIERFEITSNPRDERSAKGVMHERCNCFSQYMLYLLVKHPYMLPIGMAHIKFQEIYAEVGHFIEEQLSKPVKEVKKKEASEMLKKVNTENMLATRGDYIRNFVIFHACKLAKELGDGEGKWDIILHVWLEMLGHAASQCRGSHHAQQLRRGGELLTHVWLLMEHFGLTDHFQIPRSRAIAEAILR